jgi:hypothetical protein
MSSQRCRGRQAQRNARTSIFSSCPTSTTLLEQILEQEAPAERLGGGFWAQSYVVEAGQEGLEEGSNPPIQEISSQRRRQTQRNERSILFLSSTLLEQEAQSERLGGEF